LAQHRCIFYTELQTGNAWTFTAGAGANASMGSQRTMRVQGNLYTNSSEVVRASVLAGMGIGYAPDWLVLDALANGELQVLLPDWQAAPSPIHLVSLPERRQSAKVKAFSAQVAQCLSVSAWMAVLSEATGHAQRSPWLGRRDHLF
jgi:DNA-binding transcriptional LysR family regulator